MVTDTEALRAKFEDYINPEGDVALHWQPAGYYAGGGLQRSWLDFQSGYWAGYAAAKTETATSRLEIEMSNKSSKVSNES